MYGNKWKSIHLREKLHVRGYEAANLEVPLESFRSNKLIIVQNFRKLIWYLSISRGNDKAHVLLRAFFSTVQNFHFIFGQRELSIPWDISFREHTAFLDNGKQSCSCLVLVRCENWNSQVIHLTSLCCLWVTRWPYIGACVWAALDAGLPALPLKGRQPSEAVLAYLNQE